MLREPSSEEDLKLLERIAARDEEALSLLLRRHAAPLLRYLRRLTHDPTLAEDALQEATLSIWRHAASFRRETSPRAWLYTIARNAMMRQSRGRRPEPVEDASLEELGARAGWGDPGSGSRIEKALAERECLERALSALSLEQREVLLLVDGEGLSLEEAAETLSVSLAALKSRLHRARLRVMGFVDEEVADAR